MARKKNGKHASRTGTPGTAAAKAGRELLGGEGGGSAPATCSVPEGLCGVQKQKKSDSSFSIKFAVKRHGVFLVVFLILHEAALILP